MDTLTVSISIFVGITAVLIFAIGRLVRVLVMHKHFLEKIYEHNLQKQSKVYTIPKTGNLDWQQILHNKQVPARIMTVAEYEKVKDDQRFLHNNSNGAKSIIGLYLGEKIKIKRENKKRN